MPQSRRKIYKYNAVKITILEEERTDFKNYMTNLFPDLKPCRQKPRNLSEKEKLTEWADGDYTELKKI